MTLQERSPTKPNFGLLDPEDRRSTLPRNIYKYSSGHTA